MKTPNNINSKEFRYKQFVTTQCYSSEDNVWYGKIENIRDLVSFHSENPEGFYEAFKEACEDYLEFCKGLCKNVEVG